MKYKLLKKIAASEADGLLKTMQGLNTDVKKSIKGDKITDARELVKVIAAKAQKLNTMLDKLEDAHKESDSFDE